MTVSLRQEIIARAKAWEGTPYKLGAELTQEELSWGVQEVEANKEGREMDCSELTQYAFYVPDFFNKSPFGPLPDGATAQLNRCKEHNAPKLTRDAALQRPGALAFILKEAGTSKEYASHVAIMLGDGRTCIHAWSSGVKPSSVWQSGSSAFSAFYDPIALVEGC